MANKAVCPHTVTVFNYTGQDMARKDCYQATVLYHVHVFHQEGQISGDAADDALRVHIFDDCAIPNPEREFADYHAFEAMSEEQKASCWTLSPDGHDYICEGEAEADEYDHLPEGVTLYRIKKIGRREMGTKRMHHWKVECL